MHHVCTVRRIWIEFVLCLLALVRNSGNVSLIIECIECVPDVSQARPPAPSDYSICALILLYMRPHTTVCLYVFPHTTI